MLTTTLPPPQVRDQALKLQDNIPRSDVNREYWQQNNEVAINKAGGAGMKSQCVCLLLSIDTHSEFVGFGVPQCDTQFGET